MERHLAQGGAAKCSGAERGGVATLPQTAFHPPAPHCAAGIFAPTHTARHPTNTPQNPPETPTAHTAATTQRGTTHKGGAPGTPQRRCGAPRRAHRHGGGADTRTHSRLVVLEAAGLQHVHSERHLAPGKRRRNVGEKGLSNRQDILIGVKPMLSACVSSATAIATTARVAAVPLFSAVPAHRCVHCMSYHVLI